MSHYSSSTTAIQANAAALRIALPGLEDAQRGLVDGVTSTRLADLRGTVRESLVLSPSDLRDLVERVGREFPTWTRTFPNLACDSLASVESQLEDFETAALNDTESTLSDLHASLIDALGVAGREIATVERVFASEAAARALDDLGYRVTPAEGDGVTAFEATRGQHEKLLVAVSDGGELQTDHLGLSDAAACGSIQEDFADRLKYYGLELNESTRVDHRDPRGGGLAAGAARQGAPNLAEGIVKAFANNTLRQSSRISTVRQTIKDVS